MFNLTNIFFLILGLVLGIIIYYLIERIKEGRLRRSIAVVLKNEIIVSVKDLKEDLNRVKKIKPSDIPENIQKERIYLSAFMLSPGLYGTNAYESYMDKLYLFKDNTQKEIMDFYNSMFKIKRDVSSIRPLAMEAGIPAEAVKNHYKIQSKLRKNSLKIAANCIKSLEKEEKNRLRNFINQKLNPKK